MFRFESLRNILLICTAVGIFLIFLLNTGGYCYEGRFNQNDVIFIFMVRLSDLFLCCWVLRTLFKFYALCFSVFFF